MGRNTYIYRNPAPFTLFSHNLLQYTVFYLTCSPTVDPYIYLICLLRCTAYPSIAIFPGRYDSTLVVITIATSSSTSTATILAATIYTTISVPDGRNPL